MIKSYTSYFLKKQSDRLSISIKKISTPIIFQTRDPLTRDPLIVMCFN